MAGRRAVLLAGAACALPMLARGADIRRLPASAKLPPSELAGPGDTRARVPLPGQACIVTFWASWCAPCRIEMPLLQQMAEIYAGSLALQAVNFKEHPVTVERHVRASGWAVPILLDPQGALARAWDVKVFPSTFGFDAKGRALWRVTGEYDWSGLEAGRLAESLFK